MVKVSELPIYDKPDAFPKPKPSPCTNIENVVTSNLNNYILNPSRRFISARQSELSDLLDHVTSPIGATQVVTIAGSIFIGRKLARKVLPMSPKRDYTMPYKMAHYTIYGAVPLTAVCAWFETPREWTVWILKNSALYTGKTTYFIVEWSFYITGQIISFTFGAIWTIIKTIIWTIPVYIITGTFSVTKSVFLMLTESPSAPVEIPEAAIVAEKEEPEVDPINPSEVELELSEAQRHGEDEVLIKIGNAENDAKIEIEEDLGQSEEDDKDMFPSRNR